MGGINHSKPIYLLFCTIYPLFLHDLPCMYLQNPYYFCDVIFIKHTMLFKVTKSNCLFFLNGYPAAPYIHSGGGGGKPLYFRKLCRPSTISPCFEQGMSLSFHLSRGALGVRRANSCFVAPSGSDPADNFSLFNFKYNIL
jgi:hypothetical protein